MSKLLKSSPGDSISWPYQIAVKTLSADSQALYRLSRVRVPSSPQTPMGRGTSPHLEFGLLAKEHGRPYRSRPGPGCPLGPGSCTRFRLPSWVISAQKPEPGEQTVPSLSASPAGRDILPESPIPECERDRVPGLAEKRHRGLDECVAAGVSPSSRPALLSCSGLQA